MASKKPHHPAPQIPVSLREEKPQTVKTPKSGIDFENLGKIFRVLRENAKLTQEGFGTAVHKNTIVNLAKGRSISSKTFDVLLKRFNEREIELGLIPTNADTLWRQSLRNIIQNSSVIVSGPISQGVAFKVWWEITTRKIALELDLENHVLVEVYDSWHAAFGLIRQHVMPLPVAKQSPESETAQRVQKLCESLLNSHMRPHLTQWQARFRAWHAEQQMIIGKPVPAPRDRQRCFPEYDQLLQDIRKANCEIVLIQAELREIAFA